MIITKQLFIEFQGQAIECEVKVSLSCDPNYGADLDGHRGVYAEFIDSIDIVSAKDSDDNELTEAQKDTLQPLIEAQIEECDDLREEEEEDDEF